MTLTQISWQSRESMNPWKMRYRNCPPDWSELSLSAPHIYMSPISALLPFLHKKVSSALALRYESHHTKTAQSYAIGKNFLDVVSHLSLSQTKQFILNCLGLGLVLMPLPHCVLYVNIKMQFFCPTLCFVFALAHTNLKKIWHQNRLSILCGLIQKAPHLKPVFVLHCSKVSL